MRAVRARHILLGRRPQRREEYLTPPPLGLQEIQRQELSKLFGAMTRVRVLLLPLVAGFFAWVFAADPVPWRKVVLALALPPAAAFVVWELRRYRLFGLQPGAIERNLSAAVAGQLLLSAASGGVESPLVPLAILLAVFLGFFTTRRMRFVLVGVQVAGIWAMAVAALLQAVPGLDLPVFGSGRGGPPGGLLVADAAFLTVFLVAGQGMGRAVRKVFDAMLRRGLAARDDALRLHQERAEELTALSAEIAHELKNPLASVKGLAGLLDGSVAGKAAERLAVLRREVDRMQAILDEFLNFSRPLVPLALGRVDLGAVAREVAALHEGMAHERGLQLSVRARAVAARCDPRKVKQLLVNLVQNAIEASPPGAAVEIESEASATAILRVLDRGRGLEPSLGERVFEAGVTTKPRGSGLGLPIARALARQHGGDLRISARDGGGAVAELTLPLAPPAPGQEAA